MKTDSVSGIQPLDRSKLTKNPKNNNDVTIFWHDVIVRFFWSFFVTLVKFSYWSRFHVNIITGSGIMTISFCKGLTKNPEIGNTPVWVFPNIWTLGQIMDTKFGTDVSNRMLLNVAKCQGYSFYRFWVIELLRENQLGGKISTPPPPRLGLTYITHIIYITCIICITHVIYITHISCITHITYMSITHI